MNEVNSTEPYDLIGIGFGPSNLALSVAMSELAPKAKVLFLDRNPSFQWHSGMLLEGSRMQISYLKDLVTMRDPTSRFTFLNYLKEAGRLEQFLNLNELHPTRLEYSRYLNWVAQRFTDRVAYGVQARRVRLTNSGSLFEMEVCEASTGGVESLLARNVVVAPGGVPRIPPGVDMARTVHSSEFLPKFEQTMASSTGTGRVVLVGNGQSAGEIALYILTHYPSVELHLLISGYALRPTDNSPFVNEQFYSWRAKEFRTHSPARRAAELAELGSANYAVVEGSLLDEIYRAAYQATASGRPGLHVHSHTRLVGGEACGEGMLAIFDHQFDHSREKLECDALVLATGYERELDRQVFAEILPATDPGETGELVVSENYRVQMASGVQAGLYVQGLAEHSFGLGDTLLSLLPFRAEEIAQDITQRTPVGGIGQVSDSYPPARHIEDDEDKIYAVIERYRFATIVTAQGLDTSLVTQVPLILDRARGKHGVLFGHMDRSNPHAAALDGRAVTVLFHGPNSYISPHVYSTDQLPTWNSVTTVVHGRARVLVDREELVNGLCRIARIAEPTVGRPTLSSADHRIPPLIGGIVGFEIEIADMIGRFKLSQDRGETDRRLASGALAQNACADQSAFIDYLAGLADGQTGQSATQPAVPADKREEGEADVAAR